MQSLLLILLIILGVIVALVLPLKLAAAAVGARRTGAGWCLLALLATSVAQTIGLSFPWFGSLVALVLCAAVFAALLETTFMRGVAIAILHVVFSVILVLVVFTVLGLSMPTIY